MTTAFLDVTAAPAAAPAVSRFTLDSREIEQIRRTLDQIVARFPSAECPEFLREAALYAHELPRRLRMFVNDFRLFEPEPGCCVVGGWPVADDRIGATPAHWKDRMQPAPTFAEEALLVLLGSLLGEPIAWATQQDGYLVHDVFPIRGNEKEQLGTGCEETLTWHIEDAFHPCRGDYLALFCLRNPDGTATTWGNLDVAQLSPAHREVLFQQRYTIRPDESHLLKNRAQQVDDVDVDGAYLQVHLMNTAPPKIAVLYGSAERPYIRVDPYFMDPLTDDREAQAALDEMIALIDRRLDSVVCRPGDVLIIDNYRTVHGRNPFKARFDGRDRWLKRINIASDLRKSRGLRASVESRALRG